MCHLCHHPLLYFSLICNGPPPMSTLVPAWRRRRCCSYAGSLRGTCPVSTLTSNWHSETQISSLELSPSCHHVTWWWRKARCLDTRGFILKKIQWHIHAGSWSLVNCWWEALTRHYIRGSWILMNAAVGLMDGLSLDSDRCIRVIPRHRDPFQLPWLNDGLTSSLPLALHVAMAVPMIKWTIQIDLINKGLYIRRTKVYYQNHSFIFLRQNNTGLWFPPPTSMKIPLLPKGSIYMYALNTQKNPYDINK